MTLKNPSSAHVISINYLKETLRPLTGYSHFLWLTVRMSDSPHAEFLKTLGQFYEVRNQLGRFVIDMTIRPDSATGRHASQSINADAARQAGFSDEAIDLMYQMPYLTLVRDVEILFSARAVNYLNCDDEAAFEGLRKAEYIHTAPASSVRITSASRDGLDLFYDLKNVSIVTRSLLLSLQKIINTAPSQNSSHLRCRFINTFHICPFERKMTRGPNLTTGSFDQAR